MNIRFDYFGKNKEISISKINVFYGYSKSGKTLLCKILNDGLTQKSKTYFSVNGFQVIKNQYEVVYIDCKETIEDHIKMSTKSLIKKLYYDTILNKVDESNSFTDFVSEKFSKVNKEILSLFENLKVGEERLIVKLDENTIDDIISNSIKVVFSNQDLSSSSSKMFLYKILKEYIMTLKEQKIIIIDDFDLFFDEQLTKETIDMFKEDEKNIYLLFTNKATSLQYVIDFAQIYNIREEKLIDLSHLKKIIKYILGSRGEKLTFEEYYISNETLVLKEEIEEAYIQIKNNANINLGRMFVNKNYGFTNKEDIKINYSTEIEKEILLYIDKIIKN